MIRDQNYSTPATARLVFTAGEAAQALGVSEKTIYRLCARGLLQKAAGIRHVRIPIKSLQEFCSKTAE
jgi:excisionase family DNA binding protein